ncbi:hypothetical protein JTE90_024848 [Oedothorax gibbosus]|uniref:Uncharacterized protein n=1 Tax=Oedothorax gibbosus TaxID=931172 RepID=A0AAV6U9Y4_9ARAC|nr:hypothetical protein JTE90_024848 [Oedothorax gibbosus]
MGMMEVEVVRQRTVTRTTKELQTRCNTTWHKEKTKTTKEIVRDRTRRPLEKPQIQKQKKLAPAEKPQKQKTNTVRSKTFEKTKNAKEKIWKDNLYGSVEQLQNIIRQSSKERLQLERHLSRTTQQICNCGPK